MQLTQFIVSYSVAGILIMMLMALTFTNRNKLKDTNNVTFYMLFVFIFLTLFADLFSSFLPEMLLPGHPEKQIPVTAVASLYYVLQSATCYSTFLYVDSLKPAPHRLSKNLLDWALFPASVMLGLQLFNFFRPILFSYDAGGAFIRGHLHIMVYILPGIYLIMILVNIIGSRECFPLKRRIDFLVALAMITVCAVIQMFNPRILLVDFGAALSLLYFYFRNNDPQFFLDQQTGALDKNYFSQWITEHVHTYDEICFLIVQISNLSSLREYYGEDFAGTILQMVHDRLEIINDAKQVFRISETRFLIHMHSKDQYVAEIQAIHSWYSGTDNQNSDEKDSGEHIFRLSLLGLPDKRNLPDMEFLEAYVQFMASKANLSVPFSFVENTDEIINEFNYRREIDRFLRKAISENLFSLSFQPIYNLTEKRYTEMEVLSRLSHPEYGPISPAMFIDLAERNGLIRQVTDRQFTKLCQYLKANRELLDMLDSIKFNLSPMDLMSESHIRGLVDKIIQNDLPPEKFTFEVTESLATDFSNALSRLLRYLNDYNIHLSLDDFGSGYANLNSVLSLPVESIKMDRTLVLDISHNEAHARLYRNLIRAFHSVDLRVICEGVEEGTQVRLLTTFGADMIQGFYFSRPLSEAELPAFLKEEQHHAQGNESETEAVLSCGNNAS